MASACSNTPFGINSHFQGKSGILCPKVEFSTVKFPSNVELSRLSFCPSLPSGCTSTSKQIAGRLHSSSNADGSTNEKVPTPILDMIGNPIYLKSLTPKELKQLADEIRSELLFVAKTEKSPPPSLSAVELTIAIHYVFNAPVDKIVWDMEDQTYPHKLLTGRRPLINKLEKADRRSRHTSPGVFDPFGAGHGCSSISSGLGMAVARDIKRKRGNIVSVISNQSTMAGQMYEAMSNAGFLDPNMIVILNDTRHSLHPNLNQGPETSVNALSSILSKLQSSKFFWKYREFAKVLTRKLGGGMHEWAAKVDQYVRGMFGPRGSTLFEELGLYYIGPVDGHNIDDLVCILSEVASLDPTGPVLIHLITKEELQLEVFDKSKVADKNIKASFDVESLPFNMQSQTYSNHFVEALIREAEKDDDIVVVHAGMAMEPSFQILKNKLQHKFFDVGMAEQHAVTFSAGLSCGGMKPFCIIPSAFLQRAFDQVVNDVDRQKIPVRFVITSAGLVGSDGAAHSGSFDITFMSCLPNMIVMAPADEIELSRMVTTAVHIDDRPVCFRYPRGAIAEMSTSYTGEPIEIGTGRVLVQGEDIALLGFGSMVQNCLRAHSLLSKLGIDVTVADARFCKPLDMDLLRLLCERHRFLVTVEEGSIGGFGAHVAQFIALDGQLDAGVKWRPITLPDNYIEAASPKDQLNLAGLTGNHIAATALNLLGRTRDALLLMR